ncbi:MAG: arginase family protein, partial [Pseudohongiellaceae bacterium]
MAKFDQLAAPDYPVFLGAKIKHPKPEDAFFHVLPIPFEASASAAGTGDGPKSILAASWLLESWDGRSDPCKLGIYTHKPVDIKGKPAAVIGNICEATLGILKQKKFPVGIGGEHSSTFGIVKAFIEAGVEDFGVVQIDAHANLRDEYEGDSWNHQCVMKRIVDEDIPVFQLGVRTLAKEEHEARKVNGVK